MSPFTIADITVVTAQDTSKQKVMAKLSAADKLNPTKVKNAQKRCVMRLVVYNFSDW
jgi:hypothetical protein